jgi:hypothetical protein
MWVDTYPSYADSFPNLLFTTMGNNPKGRNRGIVKASAPPPDFIELSQNFSFSVDTVLFIHIIIKENNGTATCLSEQQRNGEVTYGDQRRI